MAIKEHREGYTRITSDGAPLEDMGGCMFCSARYTPETSGYIYHELYTCRACLDRVGLKAMDKIGHQIGKRDRDCRLQSDAKRHQIFTAAVRKYGI